MGVDNIIFLEDTMAQMQSNYLYKGDKKYIKFNKNLYGIDHDKWSSYFWELYLIKLFEEELKEQLYGIENSSEVSKLISNEIKNERERIIIYSYIQGYIFGYKNINLTGRLSNICRDVFSDKKKKKIHISEIMRCSYIKNYNEYIDKELIEINNKKHIEDIVSSYFDRIIYPKLKSMNINNSFILIKSVVYNIILKDCIDKNRDGVWDGVILKVVREFDKNYNIIM